MSLKPVLQILNTISDTSSTLEKERIIKDNLAVPFFRQTAYFALNPFLKFKIREVEQTSPNESNIPNTFAFLQTLSEESGATHSDRALLSKFSSVDTETIEVINRILKKDLRCGAGIKLFRKFIPEIPIHEPMLCGKELDKFLALARSFDNIASSIKLDGVRVWCVISSFEDISYISRNGKEFPNFSVFNKEVIAGTDNLKTRTFPIILDGEVTTKDKDFQKGLTQFRRLHKADPEIFEFHVFDIVNDLPFRERYEMIKLMYPQVSYKKVTSLKHETMFRNEKEIFEFLDMVTKEGEEGLVLKTWDGPYEFKRSNFWCKLKNFFEEDLPVIGLEKGKGKYTNVLGALICNFNGVEVRVGSGFSDEERIELLKKPPKLIEVQYQNETKDGSLRFPVFMRVREDK